MRALLATSIAALALGACTTGGNWYTEELAALESQCITSGGVLVPRANGGAGQPSTDYYCRVHGGASQLPPEGIS